MPVCLRNHTRSPRAALGVADMFMIYRKTLVRIIGKLLKYHRIYTLPIYQLQGSSNRVYDCLICSIFRALIRYTKYIKGPKKAFWYYGCNFIVWWSPTCFGYSRGRLQGGENRNSNIMKMCPNHSRV